MIEYRPSHLLNNCLQQGKEKITLLQRTQTIRDLKQSLDSSAKLESFDDDFADLHSLCEHTIKDQNFEQKAHLVDLALCYFDFLKLKMKTIEPPQSSSQVLQDIQKEAMLKMAHELSTVAHENQQQLMAYDAKHYGDDDKSLIDLLLLSEIVCFCLLAFDTATSSRTHSQITEPPISIGYSEDLLKKFNRLILSEKMHSDNQELAKNLLNRLDTGIFQSIEDLIGTVLQTHPDDQKVATTLMSISEDIFVKALTSPLNQHSTTSNAVFQHLLATTVPAYHLQMGQSIIKLVEALYKELKKGGQDPFKKKILFKINYVISLLMLNSDAKTCLEIVKTQKHMIEEGKHEMAFLLFTAADGTLVRNHHGLDDSSEIVKNAATLVDYILNKMLVFVEENKSKIEKANSMKTLVLMLKPLEEMIKICGTNSSLLPVHWRGKVFSILKAMSPIFPIQKQVKANPPNSLLESYFQLSLLADEDFQKKKNLKFVKFYQLFTIAANQIQKAEQNALVMVKIIQLIPHVEISAQDKDHFFQHFGMVMKELLQIKEFSTFFTVLVTFIDWAKTTDLQDLNFMVPDDPVVQSLLSSFMQNSKIDDRANTPLDERLVAFRQQAMHFGLKDSDIMEKFCTPTKDEDSAQPAAADKSEPTGDESVEEDTLPESVTRIEVPELCKKLVEVELMMRGVSKPVVDLASDLYKQFKGMTWPDGGSDMEFRSYLSSAKF